RGEEELGQVDGKGAGGDTGCEGDAARRRPGGGGARQQAVAEGLERQGDVTAERLRLADVAAGPGGEDAGELAPRAIVEGAVLRRAGEAPQPHGIAGADRPGERPALVEVLGEYGEAE